MSRKNSDRTSMRQKSEAGKLKGKGAKAPPKVDRLDSLDEWLDSASGSKPGTAPEPELGPEEEPYEFSETPIVQGKRYVPVCSLRKELFTLLEKNLENMTEYDHVEAQRLSMEISAEARRMAVESGASQRYRYICHAAVGECAGQGFKMISGYLWQPQTDTIMSASFRNIHNLCAVVIIYAVCLE